MATFEQIPIYPTYTGAVVQLASLQAAAHAEAQAAAALPPNPALSFIHRLLLNDDTDDDDSPSNFAELEACHAKASELAALLKEDSPALKIGFNSSLNILPHASTRTPFRYAPPPLIHRPAPHHPCEEVLHSATGDASTISSGTGRDLMAYHSMVSETPAILKRDYPSSNIDFRFPTPDALLRAAVPHSLAPPLPNLIPSNALDVRLFGDIAKQSREIRTHGYKHDKKSHRNMTNLKPHKGTTHSNSGASQGSYVLINDMLLQCASAIASNDTELAMQTLHNVRQHVSPHGNGAERLAYYLVEALDARLSGTGWQRFLGYSQKQRPTSKEILKASFRCCISACPLSKASHFFAIQTILEEAKGASTLHILEYQLTGVQYPSLFKALAARPGGPPQVRLVGFNVQHYSMLPSELEVVREVLEETGQHLSLCAASYGVPFHFTSWVGNKRNFRWSDFASPKRSRNEVLVIVSISPIRYIMDDCSDTPTVRANWMESTQAINANVYIQGIVTGSYSTPFFSRRFKETLFQFERVYDMVDTYVGREDTDRTVFESEVLGKALLNLVACEGGSMSERIARYNNWKALGEKSGLQQLPLNKKITHRVQSFLKSWHKDYMVVEDMQYLLMGWKGRMLYALSTWRSSNPEEAWD